MLIYSQSYAEVQEYQVKAVFLYNFANFIKWPKNTFDSPNAPFNICILGDDPFQQELDITVKNEKVEQRAVIIQRLNNLTNIDLCQILFISQSESLYLNDILIISQKYPILTVSDIDTFVIAGGMIQFFVQNRRIGFYIAPDILKQINLEASANLLRVAKIFHR
ncbi:YfiR family protein [Candidatus Halobeggiatoa sp. HSG11]|nr:YfiR family protein [Candidatus Halobeggiatoa sp. HSG11]